VEPAVRLPASAAAALQAAISSVSGAGGEVTLTSTGLRCRTSSWDDTGDEHHRTVDLEPDDPGTWAASVAGSPTTGVVSLSASLQGMLEVRSVNPDRFCGHATSVYDAACLLIASRPCRPAS
jgi:hypothetical protein